MRRRMRGFETAALINRDIDENGALFHAAQHLFRDELRRGGAGDKHRANHRIGGQNRILDRRRRGKPRLGPPLEQFVELAQARERPIEDRHIGAKTGRHSCRLGSGNAAAQHGDPRRQNPWDAPQQDAAAAILAPQSHARRLDREPPGDLAHRREKRKALAVRPGYGLIGDGSAAGSQQPFCLREIGRKMQKCENDLIFAQLRPFALLRFLHLYDHVGFGENFGGSVYYSGAGRQIGLIRGIDPGAGAGFDAQLVPRGGKFADRVRGQPDPIFLLHDFLRHADPHSPGSRSKRRICPIVLDVVRFN